MKGVAEQETSVNRKYVYPFNLSLSALMSQLKEIFKNVKHVHHFLVVKNVFTKMELQLVSRRLFPIAIGFLQLSTLNAQKIHLAINVATAKRSETVKPPEIVFKILGSLQPSKRIIY